MMLIYLGFSDNNSNAPSSLTAHPISYVSGYAPAAGSNVLTYQELDVPLNASGQFYMYNIGSANVTLGSSYITLVAVGFYMGD